MGQNLKKSYGKIKPILGLFLFILIILLVRPWQITTFELDIKSLFIVLIFTFFINLIAGYRWLLITKWLTQRSYSLIKFTYYSLKANFLSFIGARHISFPILQGVVLIDSEKINKKHSIYSIAINKFFDTLHPIILLPSSLLFLTKCLTIEQILALIFVSEIIALLLIILLSQNILSLFVKLYLKLVKKQKIDTKANVYFSKYFLIKMFILSLVKFSTNIIRFYFVFKVFLVSVPIKLILIFLPIIQLSLIIAISPGGIAITGASWYGLLKFVGLTSDSVNLFIIGQRIIIFICVFLLFLIFSLIAKIRSKKNSILSSS